MRQEPRVVFFILSPSRRPLDQLNAAVCRVRKTGGFERAGSSTTLPTVSLLCSIRLCLSFNDIRMLCLRRPSVFFLNIPIVCGSVSVSGRRFRWCWRSHIIDQSRSWDTIIRVTKRRVGGGGVVLQQQRCVQEGWTLPPSLSCHHHHHYRPTFPPPTATLRVSSIRAFIVYIHIVYMCNNSSSCSSSSAPKPLSPLPRHVSSSVVVASVA